MNRYFLFVMFGLALMLVGSPVMAQEAADTSSKAEAKAKMTIQPEEDVGSEEERLKLAAEMHEIWPIRPKVEAALDIITSRAKEADQARLKSEFRKSIDFQALEKESIQSMANIFTVNELKKMIEFYGSKEGRSVSYKTIDYEKSMQPIMTQVMDKALINAKIGQQTGQQSMPVKK